MKIEIFHLNLNSPLYVRLAEELLPFEKAVTDTGAEKIFCFELNEGECLAFEPEPGRLLGRLIFSGEATPGEGTEQIPKGNYLFAQRREFLGKDEIIAMAAEIQAEGLWQRLKPGKNLYLRYLFEDGSWVTQLFRPYKRTASTM